MTRIANPHRVRVEAKHRTRSNKPRAHQLPTVTVDPRRLIDEVENQAWHLTGDPLVVEAAARAVADALDALVAARPASS